MSQFISETSLDSYNLASVDDLIALDYHREFYSLISTRLDENIARLLAEPDPITRDTYYWATDTNGQIIQSQKLSKRDKESLHEKAYDYLNKIRFLCNDLINESNTSHQRLGLLLKASVSIPKKNWDEWLYSVDGNPVFVNWGLDLAAIEELPEPVEEKVKPKKTLEFNLLPLWWIPFIILSCIIFKDLIDGCGFMVGIDVNPDFCRVEPKQADNKLQALLEERKALEQKIYTLSSQVVQAPLCVSSNQLSHAKSKAKPLLPKGISVTELNEIVRGAGASSSNAISEARAVGPDNMNACGLIHDMKSSDNEAGPFFERACMGPDADLGDYLISAYHNSSSASDSPVDVKLMARSYRGVEELPLNLSSAMKLYYF